MKFTFLGKHRHLELCPHIPKQGWAMHGLYFFIYKKSKIYNHIMEKNNF